MRSSRFVALSLAPMALALVGALVDQQTHLGFLNWRSACRAAGFSPRSLILFTLELLPLAVAGALTGGVLVLSCGLLARHERCDAQSALAAHAGCAFAMVAGLLLCLLPLPVPLLLACETALCLALASILRRVLRAPASVGARTRGLTSA